MIFALAAAWARPDALGYADSAAHPIRCHWEVIADAARCTLLLEYADLAWSVQVDTLGFTAPLADNGLGGSDSLDIYLGTSATDGAGQAWVDCDGGDGTCTDADPSDGVAGAPSYVVIDARTADAILPGYMVHEFNHTTQYASDYAEPFLSVWEGTAVAAEMWSLPEVDPSVSDIADYQATPWMSAVLQDGYFLEDVGIISWYEYGAMVWVRWFDLRYGDGSGSTSAALWRDMSQEGYGYEPDVLDTWQAMANAPWQDEMLAFAADRARMGGDEGPAWLAFAGVSAAVVREGELVADEPAAPAQDVYPLGASYWDIALPAGTQLELTLDAPTSDWGIVIVESGADAVLVRGTTASYQRDVAGHLTIGVVNLGSVDLDADDVLTPTPYVLTASMHPVESEACGCTNGTDTSWLGALVALALVRRDRRPGSIARPRDLG